MNASLRWPLSAEKREMLIQTMADNLPMLRARLNISQEEIASIIGISRQTYCAIESKRRNMSWQVYLSLALFFDANSETHSILHHINAFPEVFVKDTIYSEMLDKNNIESEIIHMISKLDNQALQSVRTVIMVEYARCSKIPGEAVVKAFDGSSFKRYAIADHDIELGNAIERIKMRERENEGKGDS